MLALLLFTIIVGTTATSFENEVIVVKKAINTDARTWRNESWVQLARRGGWAVEAEHGNANLVFTALDGTRYVNPTFHSMRRSDSSELLQRLFQELPLSELSAHAHVDLKSPSILMRNFLIGAANTSSALHRHASTVNILLGGGPVLWLTQSHTKYEKPPNLTTELTRQWVKSFGALNFSIFFQHEGDAVYVPRGRRHATLNVNRKCAWSISW